MASTASSSTDRQGIEVLCIFESVWVWAVHSKRWVRTFSEKRVVPSTEIYKRRGHFMTLSGDSNVLVRRADPYG